MNRRTLLKTTLVFSAGSLLLPACLQNRKGKLSFTHFSLSADEEEMMAVLTERILPSTAFFGNKPINSHQFVLMMADECLDPEKQQSFVSGLKAFNKEAKVFGGSDFLSQQPADQTKFLESLEAQKELPTALVDFYPLTKRWTIEAFTTTQQYMENIRHYNMIPGPVYKGNVPI